MNEQVKTFHKAYDVIVIGAGHAGIEAALAAARLGCETLLLTMNIDTVAFMACNPAMGGPAKSQLIREVDALGGQIGISTDLTFLQMKMLNTNKGPAIQALRAQSDRQQYHRVMKRTLEEQENLEVKQAEGSGLLVSSGGRISGVRTKMGTLYEGKTVVVTTGTFLNGLIHVGMRHMEAGRMGEFPAKGLSDSLMKIGLRLGRLKTGTPARLNKRSIDFSKMSLQPGDEPAEGRLVPRVIRGGDSLRAPALRVTPGVALAPDQIRPSGLALLRPAGGAWTVRSW